jgi:hypothetical protein
VAGGLHGREGLGLTNGKQQGFFLHLALAILPGEERLALGTCGMERLCRAEYKGAARKHSRDISNDPNLESLRWLRLVEQVEGRRGKTECIHLIDREGDKFDLFALLKQRRARFIVRGHYDRNSSNGGRLMARLSKLKPQAYRDIEICERLDDGRRTTTKQKHPPRNGRAARVAVAGCEVTIQATETANAAEKELKLNVVKVWEPKPPPGEPAVLLDALHQRAHPNCRRALDHRRPLSITLGHRRIFQGTLDRLAIEKRQLESYQALSVALAVFLPVAWRLLLARSLSRVKPDAPATLVATEIQLELLRHKQNLASVPKTAKEATYAIAKLGGHLKRNGDPGWMTLGRGFESLLLMEVGWRLAMSAQRSDQS